MSRLEQPGLWTPAALPDRNMGAVRTRAVYALVVVLSLLVGATAVARTAASITSVANSDLANFFLKSAAYIVRGDPWHMYAVRAAPPYAAYPNVDPPVIMFLLAPFVQWAPTVGVAPSLAARVTFVSLFLLPLVPLLGVLVVAAMRSIQPTVPTSQRLLAFALVAFGPLTWTAYAGWGHLEQLVMLCFLIGSVLALQAGRAVLCGILLGLAVLTGTAALFPALALLAWLLATRQVRSAAVVVGLAGTIVLLIMTPFLLADQRDIVYAFVTWHGREQIGGNSIWNIFTIDTVTRALPHAADTVVRRLDTPLAAVLALTVAASTALRRDARVADESAIWAVLAMAAIGLPMLAKVVWPYYYLQPFVFLLIYECATLQRFRAGLWRWPVLSGGFLVITATLASYIGLPSTGPLDRVATGALEFGTMLFVLVATWRRLQAHA